MRPKHASPSRFIPADHPHIRYDGRWDFSNRRQPSHSWPGARITVYFRGSAIGVRMADDLNFYNVYIDGNFYSVFRGDLPTVADYLLVENLKRGAHTLLLSKRNAAQEGLFTFDGLLLDAGGALLPPPVTAPRRIEFIGDSYTAAEGNEATAAEMPWEETIPLTNLDQGFAPLIARHFNAQYHTICRPGIGLVCDWAGDRDMTLPKYFDRTLMDVPGRRWDFSRWVPHLAVICLGLNDFTGLQVRSAKRTDETLSAENSAFYREGYHRFLKTIRSVYPRVSILAVAAHPQWMQENVRRVVADERAAGHEDIFFAQFGYFDGGYVANEHPTVAIHQKIAAALIEVIELLDIFPSVDNRDKPGNFTLKIANTLLKYCLLLLVAWTGIFAQGSRIRYNDRALFLSGCNLAWLDFARDIGPGNTRLVEFGDIMQQMHDHGGNALRWWLHTDGRGTPQFDGADRVIGPGQGAIEDLRAVLDLARERGIGLKLCLWSFDMLRSANPAARLRRNRLLLTDSTYTRAYINHALIPMVDALAGHPAIIAWEIFNEPEGMSDEFGWPEIGHVPMAAIQRFVNLCAGAIHRGDTSAQVTSGAWSFLSLSNRPTAALADPGGQLNALSLSKRHALETRFRQRYRLSLSLDEIIAHLEKSAARAGINYYADSNLIGAGGDPDGTLDFYSVHYFHWGGTALSPFHQPPSHWGLDKPLVVAEFDLTDTFGFRKADLFERLYLLGYAGALPWSWSDPQVSTREDMLAGMWDMWEGHRADVDVFGDGSDRRPPPVQFALRQNYPNPFNAFTTIDFFLPDADLMTLEIFDISGRRIVGAYRDTPLQAGWHTFIWNGRDDAGRPLASGLYFYRLQAGSPSTDLGSRGLVQTRRMLLLK